MSNDEQMAAAPKHASFDLSHYVPRPGSGAYEHEYDAVLAVFELLAKSDRRMVIAAAPRCYVPFLRYLGHEVAGARVYFDADALPWDDLASACSPRRAVEIASTCRPELVHALYLADTAWGIKHDHEKSFPVTCNGSFFRREVLEYQDALERFEPEERRGLVLVPCAAHKPYPAPLHSDVLAVVERHPGWSVAITTGVLGLVPQELWGVAPEYDSGLPNLFRVTETVRWFFARHRYRHVVVYSDFYAHAVHAGMPGHQPATYVFGYHYRDTYSNLRLREHLHDLERAISCANGGPL